ncbi:VF530 family DNA-binding protein [Dechloromonas sp. ZS-1]|uniref:VF530 family protein n=1 Tax=Dechloromonas sp. ZS-1 TaxID=3138067 RepID=UPI0031FD210E
MNTEINYKNNPLHGVSLKTLVTEIVNHYGYELLFAYLNIQCFKTNPSIDSSVKFLKKTDWAREKVEAFYLYQFKSLPRASAEQFELPPRDRIVPLDQQPGLPAVLSLEDAERLREKRARKAAQRDAERAGRPASTSRGAPRSAPRAAESGGAADDPWAKWRK